MNTHEERQPLHLRLAAMSPEQIVDSFADRLAADLVDQGMNANDVAHVREAAGVITEILGIQAPAGRRRKQNEAPRMVNPAKQAARQARRDARRAAAQAEKTTPSTIATEDDAPLPIIALTPEIARRRRRLGLDLGSRPAQDATGNNGTADIDSTTDAGRQAA